MRIRGGPNLQLTGHSRSRFNAPGVGREWPRWPGAGRQSVTYLVPGGRHGRNVSWGETRCRPALRRRCNTERRREDRQPTPTAQVFAQDRLRLARCLSGRTCVRRQVPETAVLVDDRLRPHRMPFSIASFCLVSRRRLCLMVRNASEVCTSPARTARASTVSTASFRNCGPSARIRIQASAHDPRLRAISAARGGCARDRHTGTCAGTETPAVLVLFCAPLHIGPLARPQPGRERSERLSW